LFCLLLVGTILANAICMPTNLARFLLMQVVCQRGVPLPPTAMWMHRKVRVCMPARYPRYTHRKIPDFEPLLFILPNKVEHKAERKEQHTNDHEQVIVDHNLLPELHYSPSLRISQMIAPLIKAAASPIRTISTRGCL